jgi:NADH-quinone oxidoreductase subunit H
MKFALFFLGEYAAMIVGSALIVTLFLGGWSIGFGADAWVISTFGDWAGLVHLGAFLTKLVAFILFFILIRWTVPRFRYDQLMKLGWVVFFELALINILITAVIMTYTRGNLSTIAFIGALAGVVVFSGVMFYIAKSLDRMLASDTKKESRS